MKIYILNYFESYTGGSVVVIAKNEKRLKEILEKSKEGAWNDSEYITDKLDVEIYNKLIKPVHPNINGTVDKDYFKSILKTLSCGLRNKIKNVEEDDYTYSDKSVRLDWLYGKLKPKKGLYLIDSYEVFESLEEKIVTDTYYCA